MGLSQAAGDKESAVQVFAGEGSLLSILRADFEMRDSGLFHVFSDADRIGYVRGLETVLNPGTRLFLLCFSDATPGTEGPRRVSQPELRHAFADGWERSVRSTHGVLGHL